MIESEINERGYKKASGNFINNWVCCERCGSPEIEVYEIICSNGAIQARVFCKEPDCRWLSEPLKYSKNINANRRDTRWHSLSQWYRGEHPICEVCGKAPSEVVHHIKEWHTNPELRYEVSNLQAVCNSCHHKYHTWMKNKHW